MQANIKDYTNTEYRNQGTLVSGIVRKKRTETFNQIKNNQVDARTILFNLDDYEHMRNARVNRFIYAHKGITKDKATVIMRKCHIASNRRLGGLGIRQKTALIEEIEKYAW